MTLYSLPFHNKDLIEEKIDMFSFVFLGKNWDFYFENKPKNNEFFEIEDVVFSLEYPEKMDDKGFLDYDRDQEVFLLLEKYIPSDFPKEKIFREYKEEFFMKK